MAITCPNCQSENASDAAFCNKCGSKLELVEGVFSPQTKTLQTPVKDLVAGTIIAEKYKLIEELGRGGMGVVYLAEQIAPVKRKVAVKIIKLGMDTKQVMARFEAERQALAMMDHPNIAKVFDAGTTETGRPYFVMEYVKGIPITEYCDTHRLNNRERLELFQEVCKGVQHAHQKGIIHRDIKASNILVAIQDNKPVPKIIDFGVAKATAQRLTERTMFTEIGQLIGTPEYMSPEQAEMTGLDIDTRTDVYSLGVLLYELLAGVLPFDSGTLRAAGLSEIQRIIRETDPPKASTRLSSLGDSQISIAQHRKTDPTALRKQLKGDLDWIILKAMEKDRTRRYDTVNELALDITRHLNKEPVMARPPSTAYKAQKMIARHKIGFGFSVVLFILLVGFAISMTVFSARVASERDRAEEEAAKAKAINAFLQDILGSANPIEGSDKDITILEALETATDKIEEAFANQPEVETEVRHTIGVTYLRLGHYDKAEDMLRSALNVARKAYPSDHPELASPLTSLAVLLHEKGKLDGAESLYREALDIRQKHFGREDEGVASILSNLGILLQERGDYDAAEPIFREILAIDRKLLGDDNLNVAVDLNNLGNLLRDRGDYEASEPLLKEAISILQKHEHPWVSIAMSNLGELMNRIGDYDAAEPIFEEALSIGLKHLGDKNQDIAKLRSRYGECLLNLGKLEKAEGELLAALPILMDTIGEQNKRTQQTILFLVELYEALDRIDEAEMYRQQLVQREH
ncbi:MAG: tetratricopeptide repeat protein [Candidatus Aminicenantes bacterium]|nr:tetratricopeptide repeat protein [Candidatus Aminicenantes bacterium]